MIYRNYLGLDLQPQAMRAVALRRRGNSTILAGGRLLGLDEGVLAPSFRTPNVIDVNRFIDGLHEILDPLASKEERLSIALPEQSGLMFLADIESVLKSKSEGIDVLKWQLREKLPEDVELQMDYQILDRDETGRQKVLVSAMAVDVLQQYEEVIAQAGYGAELIGFRSMALYNFYRTRFDADESFVLLQIEDDVLNLQYYLNNRLTFHRSRVVGTDTADIYREINRSLAGEKDNMTGVSRASVYLHTNYENPGELCQALGSLFVNKPTLLKPALEKLSIEPLSLTERQAHSLVTAVGAAERLM